ncbi:MAG: hypothetical protein COA42_17515, partial [Alteromonadaceae bacterium]
DTPVANADSDTVNEAATVIIDLRSNDTDAETATGSLTVTNLSVATNGSIVNNNDGTVTYTHDGSETTNDSFTYTINDGTIDSIAATVTVTINAQNDAPVANADSGSVNEGAAVTIDLRSNDTDAETATGAMTVTNIGSATNGSIVNNNDGTVTYTHNGSETVGDSFTYTINDGTTNSVTTTVTITVSPQNDTPIANADSDNVSEGASVTINLRSNDTDAETTNSAMTITNISAAINGSVINNNNGTVTYTHDGSETTGDSFTYTINDGIIDSAPASVTLTITGVNDTPTIAANNAGSMSENGSLTITSALLRATDIDNTDSTLILSISGEVNGNVTVNNIAASSFTQNDIDTGKVNFVHDNTNTTTGGFNFTVSDGTDTLNGQSYSINVTPVDDDTPTIVNASVTLNEGTTITLTLAHLSANDADTDNTTLIYTVGNVSVGDLSINSSPWSGGNNSFTQQDIINGNVVYTHDGSNTISDSFTFSVMDTATNTLASQTLSITVVPVDDDSPIASNSSMVVYQGGTIIVTSASLSATDSDSADNGLTYTVSDVTSGNLSVNGSPWSATNNNFTQQNIIDGTVIYTHDGSNSTVDLFNYSINDGAGNVLAAQAFNIGIYSLNAYTTITMSAATFKADGTTASTITVQTKDSLGSNVIASGITIALSQDGNAILSAVTDNGDGTYTATITSGATETVNIIGTINADPILDTITIVYVPADLSAANTTITTSPSVVTANGSDISLLTIQTFDALDHPLTAGGHNLILLDNNNAIISQIIDHGDGTYTATISNSTVQSTTITGTIDGGQITDIQTINFVQGGDADINTSDGKFINGIGPLGSTIEVLDAQGNPLCSATSDITTGEYHCIITTPVMNGDEFTVIATDLAGNSETSSTTLNALDTDDDGISNVLETLISNNGGATNTQPDTDTDGDGLPDYAEIILGSDLLERHSPVIDGGFDSDLDGIPDAVEYFFNSAGGATDSMRTTDSDGDGIPDITELVSIKSNFNHVDLPIENGSGDDDGDNVTNAVEYYLSLFSIVADETSDYDHDGYSDALEIRLASNPLKADDPDMDLDGVNDAIEHFITGTINDGINTALIDSDGDSLPDIFEISLTTDFNDPLDPVNDSQDGDADFDGMSDAIELYIGGDTTSATLSQDTDGDGVTDVAEVLEGSNPMADSRPVVWVNVSDLGSGEVEIQAILGGYQAPYPSFSWDTSAILNADPGALIIDTNGPTLTISNLSPGIYYISASLTKIVDGQIFASSINQMFAATSDGTADSDFDGISNSYDIFDGTTGSEEKLNTAIGSEEPYEIQLEYGAGVRAGLIARMGDNQVGTITNEQLVEYINQDFPISSGDTSGSGNIASAPNLFDVDIVNIPSSGDTIDIVMPLNRPLSSSAAVLIFDHINASWSFMDTSNGDSISSAMGSPGNCPALGDSSYTPGMTEGGYCLQLGITDGGPNDRDTAINGSIPLLVGIGTSSHLAGNVVLNDGLSNSLGASVPSNQTDSGSSNIDNSSFVGEVDSGASGGGGSVNPVTLLILMLGSLGFYRNTSQRQR